MQVPRLARLLVEVGSLPGVTIRLFGDVPCHELYRNLIRQHPRYKLIQHKRWGVALLKLPDEFEAYLSGRKKSSLRTNRRRASDLGYRFGSFNPNHRLKEILAINGSSASRQGRPMLPEMLDIAKVEDDLSPVVSMFGVFDMSGVLKAYAETPICGEVFLFSRLLGHQDDLKYGIMYLLVSEVIREMIELKSRQGTPVWAMYDTLFGAGEGLRYFKERLGFQPYKVSWNWALTV